MHLFDDDAGGDPRRRLNDSRGVVPGRLQGGETVKRGTMEKCYFVCFTASAVAVLN